MDKKGFELSFGWLFAILVGAIIIFLAIYAAGKVASNQNQMTNTQAGKELGILLSPVETSLDSGKSTYITFPRETKVGNICSEFGNFGAQRINTTGDTGITSGDISGVSSTFYNKYLFSNTISSGKTFYVFAKPFEMPYKVADLIFFWGDKEYYCFVNPSNNVEDEILGLNLKNIKVVNSVTNCSVGSKKVCFTRSNCDVDVSMNSQTVRKENRTMYFEGPLLYGAIFASPEIYECQVKRLMKRDSELALLYATKADTLAARGCGSNLREDLIVYADMTLKVDSSSKLSNIAFASDNLERRNHDLLCQIF